ncbi:MAG: DMT family transporter [Acidiferrobacter sp.]
MTKDRWFAISALLVGAGSWGVLWYPLRAFAQLGLPGVWLAVVLFAGASVSGWLLCRVRRRCAGPWSIWLVLALLGGITNIGFVVAVLHDNILRVTLLFYLSPVWSVLLARVFLDERLSFVVIFGVGTAILGAVILLWRDASLALSFSDGLALVSGFSFAAANVVLRAQPSLSLETKVFSTFLGVVMVGLLVLVIGDHSVPTASMRILAYAGLLGGIVVFGITLFVQYGVTVLPVRQSSVILLFEVITAAFSQHILLHRVLGAQAGLGALVIAAGATLVAAYES